jgi:FKBP-type peptidyl-prolyl cis-trans isomerase FklB
MPTDAAGRAYLAQKAQEPGVISRPSGLLYKYIEKGSGTGHPMGDTPCDFHYRGTLINGQEFDSSYKRGKPSEFTANGVVPGCTEGYQLMVEGDKVMFYIPSELAYGDAGIDGLIPSGAVLVFEVHLVKIKGPTKPKVGGQASAQMPQYAPAPATAFFSSATPGQTFAQPQYAQTQYSQAQVVQQPQVYTQPQMYTQQAAFTQPQVYTQSPVYGQSQVYAQAAPLTSGVYGQQAFSQPAFGQPQVFMQGGFR